MSISRIVAISLLLVSPALADSVNLFSNPLFTQKDADGKPFAYQTSGDVEYRYLGDPRRDFSSWGVALNSSRSAGLVSQTVTGIDAKDGRWFRFTFRGLAQEHFSVNQNDLLMRVEFFGANGRTPYDAVGKFIYPQILDDRKNLTVNGDFHVNGAAVWRTYQLDFWLPFPQIDTLRCSVSFGHGNASNATASQFYVGDFNLTRLTDPPADLLAGARATTKPSAEVQPHGNLIPLGGRWFYDAKEGESAAPQTFDHTNAERLLYHDAGWQAPFADNMTAILRAGDKDLHGNIVQADQLVNDNVTVNFDDTSMIIHTKSLPNHPTAKFPEFGFGPGSNPNYIEERLATYFIPVEPKVNPRHIFTTTNNSNHALPMGPIGIALNGVVFFNPFDAQSQDASNIMDSCCGHPAPDGTYHYHKYPVCLHSPWSDDGNQHSPLIGFAFDGFPIYGPYESNGVMAKDATGDQALNEFNLHFDKDRGWHYHVTPGKFPYIIGGYWGTEDSRDMRRGRGPGGGGGPGGPGGMRPPPPGGF